MLGGRGRERGAAEGPAGPRGPGSATGRVPLRPGAASAHRQLHDPHTLIPTAPPRPAQHGRHGGPSGQTATAALTPPRAVPLREWPATSLSSRSPGRPRFPLRTWRVKTGLGHRGPSPIKNPFLKSARRRCRRGRLPRPRQPPLTGAPAETATRWRRGPELRLRAGAGGGAAPRGARWEEAGAAPEWLPGGSAGGSVSRQRAAPEIVSERGSAGGA